jgi:response regulator RpfG family c-di-GMP phosphodiesterase
MSFKILKSVTIFGGLIAFMDKLRRNKMQRTFNVVMVDDDQDDLEIMKEAFSTICRENDFGTFDSGKQLIHYLDNISSPEEYPSVVMLDHNLAGENGKEIILKLKGHAISNQMTFVIFSSAISPLQEEQLKDVGVITCLKKPSVFHKFVEVAKYLCTVAESNKHQ